MSDKHDNQIIVKNARYLLVERESLKAEKVK